MSKIVKTFPFYPGNFKAILEVYTYVDSTFFCCLFHAIAVYFSLKEKLLEKVDQDQHAIFHFLGN